jgi:hypothetical protein
MANRKKMMVALVIVVVGLACSSAYAADTGGDKDWEFQLVPLYFWGASLYGTVSLGPVAAPIDMDFDDLFDALESIFTVHFEAVHRQKWGILTDWSYMDLAGSQSLPGNLTLDGDLESLIAEGAVFYRMAGDAQVIDILGGVRYTDMEISAEITGRPRRTQNPDWLDPIIGGRYGRALSEKWKVSVRGDIGGFGIGDASDFAWNISALLHYQPWKHVGFVGGYRLLDMDYKTGSGLSRFEYDVLMHGPIFGLNILF